MLYGYLDSCTVNKFCHLSGHFWPFMAIFDSNIKFWPYWHCHEWPKMARNGQKWPIIRTKYICNIYLRYVITIIVAYKWGGMVHWNCRADWIHTTNRIRPDVLPGLWTKFNYKKQNRPSDCGTFSSHLSIWDLCQCCFSFSFTVLYEYRYYVVRSIM